MNSLDYVVNRASKAGLELVELRGELTFRRRQFTEMSAELEQLRAALVEARARQIQRPEGEPHPTMPAYLWSNASQCYVLGHADL